MSRTNRLGVALVVFVVLAIGVGAWWLSELPVEVIEAPPAPVIEPVEAPPPIVRPTTTEAVPPAPAPAPVLAEVDAGVMAEVEIEVVQNGARLIGVRVGLEGPGGRVSRPTDVMGYARFTLPTGRWRITSPTLPIRRVPYDGGSREDYNAAWEVANTLALEVSAPLTTFRMELPTERLIVGRVVDSQMRPAPGVDVEWTPSEYLSKAVVTGPDGAFSIKTTAPALQLQAARRSSRSPMRVASPGVPITLVLEDWTQLRVDVSGPGSSLALVRVIHRDEIVVSGFQSDPLRVPVGALSVLARRIFKGRAFSGKARIDTKPDVENTVEVELGPTPPITGKLVDAAGHPMPGLSLHIGEVDLSAILELARERPIPDLEALRQELNRRANWQRADAGVSELSVSTQTNHLGEFTWTPTLMRNADPLYQVTVVGLWRAQAESVLVKLDDAPLEIVVEPRDR